ncbi:hypothetical protein CPLU01_02493 [Colletotrichum plurivorum]|uniref:Uncharacterized protein n=1 Tax=Colletotrichum plurivorum TaxID=2175906 RepID=A0A8H6NMZ5_9PEZI|nr:hypothetical protein CPLU01_02493 [Colletotrichum plurivorum]
MANRAPSGIDDLVRRPQPVFGFESVGGSAGGIPTTASPECSFSDGKIVFFRIPTSKDAAPTGWCRSIGSEGPGEREDPGPYINRTRGNFKP